MYHDALAIRSRMFVVLTCFLLLGASHSGFAAKPSDQVLPASTKFSWSIANQQEYEDRLATTQLGKLLLDPAMQPFLDDLPRQMREEASSHPLGVLWIDLGLKPEDTKGLSEGEVTWALVQEEASTPSRIFLADVSNRADQAEALLGKIADSMRNQNAKKAETAMAGTQVTSFDVPASGNSEARTLHHFMQDDLLVLADSESAIKTLLNNLQASSTEVLGQQADYQAVMKTCRERGGEEQPDAVLYLVPVDLMDALNELAPEPDERAEQNLAIARKHNFDAVSAVGSFVTVGQGAYDFYARIAIHAPKPWKNGMQVCQFPNLPMSTPAWVRDNYDAFSQVNVDFTQFSKHFGPLFDDVYGEGEEGLYDDLKNTLGEDPDGPQVDLDKEIYGKLSPQVTLLARTALPVTPESPQRLIAFSTSDETALASTVAKALEADPSAEAGQVAGHQAFFSYTEEEESDGFDLDLLERDPDQPPSFITCVANGHLMFATDVEILEYAIAASSEGSLTESDDYKRVAVQWDSVGDKLCARQFARLKDALRADYELLRQGKKPAAGKSFKGLLNNIAMGEPPEVSEPDFDGSKLPAFDVVQHYFGTAGLAGFATEDGWCLDGFVLKKE